MRPQTTELPPISPSEKWNLGALESGPDGEEEKARHASELPSQSASTPTLPEKDETLVTFPEGGVRAWLVVFGSWCGILASLGTLNSSGSFQAYFMAHQLSKYSPSVVGWIFSVYPFLAFGGSFLVGPIFDKYGPRWLVLAGSIGVCLSMFLVGICKQYWQFLLVVGFLQGLSACLLLNPSIAVVGHYFCKKRGNATGIVLSSGAVGGVAFPLLLGALIPRVGFAWSTRIIGFIYVVACVFACSLIRSRLPPGKNAHATPDVRIFKDPAFTITVLAISLFQWAFLVPIAYISSYALHYGFSTAFSYHALVFLNVGSVFGRWLPGFTSDRIGRYNSAILMTSLTIATVLGVWLPAGHTKAGLVVVAFSFGFTSGSLLTLTTGCIGQLCQTKNYGAYLATAFTVASIGYLTGVPVGGGLVAMDHGGYQSLIIFVGLCYVGAAAAVVVVRILGTGWKLRVIY